MVPYSGMKQSSIQGTFMVFFGLHGLNMIPTHGIQCDIYRVVPFETSMYGTLCPKSNPPLFWGVNFDGVPFELQ